jgi:hypothetical protein
MNHHLFPIATRHALRATVLAVLCAVPLAQAATSFYARTELSSREIVSQGPFAATSLSVEETTRRTYTPTRRTSYLVPGTLRLQRDKTTLEVFGNEDGTVTYPPLIEHFDKTFAAPSFPAGMAMAATGTSSGVSAAGVLQIRASDYYNTGPGSSDYLDINTSAQAGFSDDWLFRADAAHPAGTTGSFITWINLSGQIGSGYPVTATISPPARLATVEFRANGTVATAAATWRDDVQSVGAVVTTPFVYGTPFAVSFNLYSASGPGITAGPGSEIIESFSARIAYLRTPRGSVLQHHLSGLPVYGGMGSSTAAASREFAAMNMAAPVPEPGTWALMIAGLAAVGGVAKRRVAAKA